MLDDMIIEQIRQREKKRREDSGWQPVPLYKELELPLHIPEEVDDKSSEHSGPIVIDIGGQDDDNIIQTNPYFTYFIRVIARERDEAHDRKLNNYFDCKNF